MKLAYETKADALEALAKEHPLHRLVTEGAKSATYDTPDGTVHVAWRE